MQFLIFGFPWGGSSSCLPSVLSIIVKRRSKTFTLLGFAKGCNGRGFPFGKLIFFNIPSQCVFFFEGAQLSWGFMAFRSDLCDPLVVGHSLGPCLALGISLPGRTLPWFGSIGSPPFWGVLSRALRNLVGLFLALLCWISPCVLSRLS